MSEIYVVLVELKIPENIGFIARVAKNFGISKLCLYNCNVRDESYSTAAHAKDLLENSIKIDDLFSFLSKMSLIIGTTGISGGDYKYLRKPLHTPEELVNVVEGAGNVAVLFGREDYGLYNEELEMCHVIVKIPTSEEYPVMNVSHAAAILLYFLTRPNLVQKSDVLATSGEIEVLLNNIKEMLEMIEYPKHRIRRTLVVFRRVLGRAKPTQHEVLTINGVFRKTVSYIKRMLK